MKNTILIFVLIFSASFMFAQTNVKKETETTSRQSSIVFKQTVSDFGVIKYGEEAKGVFEFKNLSKKPVKLTNVRASCGCTGTEWPREEIKKRGKGTVSVSYDTRRVGKFHKNVYVYVDGSDQAIQLEVKGEVLPKDGSVIDSNQSGNKGSKKSSADINKVKSKSSISNDAVRKTAAPQKNMHKKEGKSLDKKQ